MSDTAIFLRIVGRYCLVLLSITGVSFMFWYFIGVFVKKINIKIPLLILMIAFCVFLYIMNHRKPNVIYMHEDVLYVIPKNDIK
jgi:hypothetical protein